MADTAETLREKVLALFEANVNADPEIAALLDRIHGAGGTGYADADAFALRIGQALANAYKTVQDELPEHIDAAFADTLLREALRGDYAQVADAAAAVQKALNEQAGLGLNAVRPKISTSRIEGLVGRLAGAEKVQDALWLLDDPVKNFSMSVVDDTVRANVEFQGKAGLRPRVVRTMHGKSCKWCQGLAGAYDYPDVPKEVYRRHERCRCTVTYDPGVGKRVQDVWSKRWTSAEERDKIEARKSVGLARQTGAQSGAKKTPGWEDRHAKLYYEEVRSRVAYTDARKIVRHVSGFSVQDIEDIRQHVFIKEQPRNGGYYRFDESYEQAEVWQRLIDGKHIRQSDLVFLKHEHLELTLMREKGYNYEQAHELANKEYDWWKAYTEEE